MASIFSGSEWAAWSPAGAGRRRLARLVGEDDAEHEDHGREDGQQGAGDPQLDAPAAAHLARLGAALGAVAAQRVEEAGVDRDDDDRRGDEADPKQRVDLVGARRVGRQSAAILITRVSDKAARGPPAPARPILADPMRRRCRPSPALRVAVRAGAAAAVAAAIAGCRCAAPGSGFPRR